jgi:hypothetical protein
MRPGEKPVGEYFDATSASPQELTPVPAGTTFGRSVLEPKSKFVSAPVRIANGRPELIFPRSVRLSKS